MNKPSKLQCSRCPKGCYGLQTASDGAPLCRDCSRVGPKARRPCANGCGMNTLKFDTCHHCRDLSRPPRKQTGLDQQKGQGCKQCEGMSWRRPVRGKCKCGKRFEPEKLQLDASMQRSASIFDPGMSTRV